MHTAGMEGEGHPDLQQTDFDPTRRVWEKDPYFSVDAGTHYEQETAHRAAYETMRRGGRREGIVGIPVLQVWSIKCNA